MYSLKYRYQKSKNKKRSFTYFVLFIATIIFLLFIGVKIFVYLINFITDIKKSNTVSSVSSQIPPRIPNVYPVPEYTNNSNLEIGGNAEVASIVYLYFNNKESDTVVGNDGNFIFKEKLSDGDNSFFLNAQDKNGNKSANTKTYHIIYDNTAPDLSINSPQNDQEIYGSQNQTVEIKGTTESDSTLTINGKFVNVSSDGSFIYKYPLQEGSNQIEIKAKDPAGNEKSISITVKFSL